MKDSVDDANTKYALIPSMSTKHQATIGRNTLLAGDAAGVFVSALSGEGIYYACLSGKFAAQTAAIALKKDDLSLDTLGLYRRLWLGRLKHELDYQYWAKGYMLEVKRRCEKAIRWGLHDEKINKFLSTFFAGAYDIDRTFMARLIGQYIRLKFKDRLGMLGEREKKSDYPKQ
jgi:flavin-dependent dehydrogenase